MDSRLILLIKGELKRMNRYGITTVSILVAVLWFVLLYSLDDSDILSALLPFIIVIDATMMAAIYVGAVMFFERSESTIATLLVTPIANRELILSKVIANTIHSVLSSLLVVIAFTVVKDVGVSWVMITLALIVSVSFHSFLGFVFSYHAKDFTSMLMNVMLYALIFALPSALRLFDVMFKGSFWEYALLINPTQAAIELVMVGFREPAFEPFFISLSVLVFGGYALYRYYVLPNFKDYAVKESGV
ncbi:MAG: hypothetical protein ACLFSU_04950 [Acholeplasmataceae bacterium]